MAKINLKLINGVAHTFNSDDYLKIRKEHRIKGNLIGCVSTHPRNFNFSGLPAVFSNYETQLLIDKGFAILTENPSLLSPSDADKTEYTENIKRIRLEQNDFLKENKLETTKKMLPKIIEGKRKKFKKSGLSDAEIEKLTTPENILIDEKLKIPDLDESNSLVQIPIEHPIQLNDLQNINDKINRENSLKYRVFCELWSKGEVYITEGDTFGCDFLLYPGDPIYFHASHIIHVLEESEIEHFKVKMLIGQLRLSVNVNKNCIYAYLDRILNKIVYQQIKWEGNLT